MLLWVLAVYSFLLWSGIPLSEYASICLPVLLMGDLGYLGFPFYEMGEILSISLDCCEVRVLVSDGKNAWHMASAK